MNNQILGLWPHFLSSMMEGAIAAKDTVGHGDKNHSDHCAVEAIRNSFRSVPMKGKIVIGEGERDDAPMLYIGEEVGLACLGEGGNKDSLPEISIAIDPLEGTTPCAKGKAGSICVMAWSSSDGIIGAADGYAEKLVVGPSSVGRVSLDKTVEENLIQIAEPLGRPVNRLEVVVLDRPRNQKTIDAIRNTGAVVRLIDDGDLSAGIDVMVAGSNVHCLMGSGGAPEGHILAAAAHCLGGEIQMRYLHPKELDEFPKDRGNLANGYCERMEEMGLSFGKIYTTSDLAPGDECGVVFVNVTEGSLDGKEVTRFSGGMALSWSVMLREKDRRVLMPGQKLIEITEQGKAFRI